MNEVTVKTPWKEHLGEMPFHLDYFEGSMFEALEKIAQEYPDYVAFDFMGKSTTYSKLKLEIENLSLIHI